MRSNLRKGITSASALCLLLAFVRAAHGEELKVTEITPFAYEKTVMVLEEESMKPIATQLGGTAVGAVGGFLVGGPIGAIIGAIAGNGTGAIVGMATDEKKQEVAKTISVVGYKIRLNNGQTLLTTQHYEVN